MKKSAFFIACMLTIATAICQNTQRYVLFEYFTGTECPACASVSPGWNTNFIDYFYGQTHEIVYHTPIPVAGDPFYAYNSSEADARMSFYSVSSAPHVAMDGIKPGSGSSQGHPSQLTQPDVTAAIEAGSPISVIVSQTSNGNTRDVKVVILTIGTVPSGSYKLRTAVVESEISYTGGNGLPKHRNVFRKMLPNTGGETYTPAAIGDSAVFNYSYTIDSVWQADSIYVISFVQNSTDKKVLNSGSNYDPKTSMNLSSVSISETYKGSSRSFTGIFKSNYSTTESFSAKLTTNAPSDWTASFTINSIQYTDTATIQLGNYDSVSYSIDVLPGVTPALAEYTLTLNSITYPKNYPIYSTVYIMSELTDLIVNNNQSLEEGGTYGFETLFKQGLDYAQNKTYASISKTNLLTAHKNDQLKYIRFIYYNVGWTAPSLTDELVDYFTNSFFKKGGRLMVSGQDVGWETWDPSGFGTTNTKSFYTTYLGAEYVKDDISASNLSAVTGDALFGTLGNSAIDMSAYTSNNTYPDQLKTTGNGKSILYYDANTANVACVRASIQDATSNWKTVYMGIGLEQIQDTTVRKEFMKITHDWFHDVTGDEEFDKQMGELMRLNQNYPNPSNFLTKINFENIPQNCKIQISDALGRVIETKIVSSNEIELNTTGYKPGIYNYYLIDEKGNILQSQKMEVIHN